MSPLEVVGLVGFLWLVYAEYTRNGWEEAGAEFHLEVDRMRPLPPRLRGGRGGFEIVVARSRTKIVVQVLGVDPWFTLSRNDPHGKPPDIETGDAGFDQIVRVEGDRDLALGLLASEVRRSAEEFVRTWNGSVREGKMEARIYRIRELPEVLRPMLHLANLLRRPPATELPRRLARNAMEDPSEGARLQSFLRLRDFSEAAELGSTARALLHGTRGRLRLEAARSALSGEDPQVRPEAVDALSEMARQPDLESELRRSALERLSRAVDPTVAIDLARRLLARRDEPPEMRCAALVALVDAGASCELLDFEPRDDPAEAETLARGLGECSDPRAQPRLLELLDHAQSDVRIAAATSLGAVGDVRAVRTLRRLAEDGPIGTSRLVQAAERAVGEIQVRLGGSQAGEVSLVEPAPLEGAVSPAGDAAEGSSEESRGGEVSLA